MTDIAMVYLLSNLDKSHNQCNASSIYLEQTFLCKVDLQLNFRRKKRSILNVNLKNYRRQIQHPAIDLKMELTVKIVNDFKL